MITLDDFLGGWCLNRTIKDLNGQSSGQFQGEAMFAWIDAARLSYREEGLLTLNSGQVMRAERGYIWQHDGYGVDVLFGDGRAFHRFDLSADAEADHWCDPDMYRVTYAFGDWPVWHSQWRVKGPCKDYVMRSDYAR